MSSANVTAFLAEYAGMPSEEALPERYVPLECLAEGRFGETFLCRDAVSGDLVVAKKCEARFARIEGDMLARLHHPGLPALIALAEAEACAYLIRSYVPGVSLEEYAQKSLPEAQALDILRELLEILAYLHAQRPPVVHRDVKPSNIIFEPETGKVSLIDLGIARICDREGEADTVLMGTRAFAPPEQYGFMQTDSRADVYAAGMVLKWMLPEPACPAGLRRMIRKMTAFDPDKRYPDARSALRALRRYRTGALRKGLRASCALSAAVALAAFGFWLGRYTPVRIPPMAAVFERVGNVAFSDAVLEARVRSQMAAPEGQIAARDALKVEALDLSASAPDAGDAERISDISALSAFSNLRSLDLSWNRVEDIAPLSGLTKLEALYLNGNGGISDLTPLENLTAMRDIMLVGCQVFSDSAEVFRDMSGLVSFWVESPRLKAVDVVGYFPSLERLVIKNCGVTDLKPVTALQNLRQIDVSGSPVEDLTVLLELPHLAYATFSEDQRALVEAQLSGAAFDIQYA